jgi:hypothetical protein
MESLLNEITWRPGIGDPYPLAWMIVALHFAAGCFCIAAVRQKQIDSESCLDLRSKSFWIAVAVFMFCMCLNKQLDLQTLLDQVSDSLTKREGWREQRRTIEVVFVIACAVVSLVAAIATYYVARVRWRQHHLAYVGIVLLLTFIVMRAATFHRVAVPLTKLSFVRLWMSNGLEIGGSTLVAIGAYLATRKKPTATAEVITPVEVAPADMPTNVPISESQPIAP